MKIKDVTVKPYYRYIPLKGWDSVTNALNLYASGLIRKSTGTQNRQLDDIGKAYGGDSAALYMVALPHCGGTSYGFVTRMLTEAKEALAHSNSWSRSYDYDGEGVFFKTSVGIGYLSVAEDMYYLSIHAAYVGSEPEAGLAERLGIMQGLVSVDVNITLEPHDQRHFEIDFNPIMKKLNKVLGNTGQNGKSVVKLLRERSADRNRGTADVLVYDDTNICAKIGLGRVESRYTYVKGVAYDTWDCRGSKIYGLLCKSYTEGNIYDGNLYDYPSVYIEVRRLTGDRYQTAPMYKPDDKVKAASLARAIAEAFTA